MKKAMLASILLALFACGAYLSPLLFAQQHEAIAVPPTKVFVVNIRAVIKQNARAKALQAELEESLKPHKVKAKKLSDEINALSVNDYRHHQKKTEWDTVNAEILRLIEEKHKDKMPGVWSQVIECVEAVGKCYGNQMVLGYGDPDDPDVSAFHNIKGTKLHSTEMGCTVMTYVHQSVDITPVVIQTMNKLYPK